MSDDEAHGYPRHARVAIHGIRLEHYARIRVRLEQGASETAIQAELGLTQAAYREAIAAWQRRLGPTTNLVDSATLNALLLQLIDVERGKT